jgi:aromatic ring-opening dioxygenase catalytic subunit (LigB family)
MPRGKNRITVLKGGPVMAVLNPVFIGHGSPENAIADNRYSRFLSGYAKEIPRPASIVVSLKRPFTHPMEKEYMQKPTTKYAYDT